MIPEVVAPCAPDATDFVIGTRIKGPANRVAFLYSDPCRTSPRAHFIRIVYGVRFTDMSPFRAIGRERLAALGMREDGFGWNLEMQMRAAAAGPSLRRSSGWPALPARWGLESFRQPPRFREGCWVLFRTFLRLASGLRRGSVLQTAIELQDGVVLVRRPDFASSASWQMAHAGARHEEEAHRENRNMYCQGNSCGC